jgi:flagellar hook-associated protein 1 FlgK
VSGVSLDEEMVNLVKYEAAYNAAAKMISMADDMLDTLMNIVR